MTATASTSANANANDSNEMYVIKRNGEKQEISFDKIMRRLKT